MSWNLKSRSILMKGILTLIKLCYGFCWNIMNLQVFDEIQNVCKFWCKLIYKSLPWVVFKITWSWLSLQKFLQMTKKMLHFKPGVWKYLIWAPVPGQVKMEILLVRKKITCPDFFVELVLCLTYMLIYWVDLLII